MTPQCPIVLPPPPACRSCRPRRGRRRVRPAQRDRALLRRAGLGSFRRHALLRLRTARRRRASPTSGAGGAAASAQQWPEWAPSPYSDTPPQRVAGPEWRISYVGHASLLIQTAGLNILIDPVWSERVLAGELRRAEARQRSGHRVRRAAADRHRAGLALPLRSSRRRHAVAASRRAQPARDHAARQRHHHEGRTTRAIRAEAYDWHQRVDLGARRRRHDGADAPLVGARADRSQQGAVGVVRDRDAGRAHLSRGGFRLWRRHALPRRARPLRPVPAGDPADRRLRAALVHARHAHEPGGGGAGVRHGAAPSSRSAITTARSSSPTRRSTRRSRALDEARVEAGVEPERFRLLRPGQVWEVDAVRDWPESADLRMRAPCASIRDERLTSVTSPARRPR